MEKRAIAYAADIILGNTGEIIDRTFQKARIEEYAKENNIEIVAWFEDEAFTENLFARPKLKEMIGYEKPYEYLLVERVWAVSRKWMEVKAFLKVLEVRRARMEAATTLWDCVSQMARTHYRKPGVDNGIAPCAVEHARAMATSVNLVKEYGRCGHEAKPRRGQAATGEGRKLAIRRPNRLALGGLRFRTAAT